MSNQSLQGITRVRGALCINPTDLSIAYPHGGTAIGVVRTTSRRYISAPYTLTAEEFGGAPIDVITDSESPVVSVVMATWDTEMLTRLFGGGRGATTSRGSLSRDVGTFRAGVRRAGLALYVSPDDDDDPGIFLYNAISMVRLDGETIFNARTEYGLPIAFQGLPDANGRVLYEGLRSDIPL